MVNDQLNETVLMCFFFKFTITREKSNAFNFQSSDVNN